MKNLKVMVAIALLWVCTIAAQATTENLVSIEYTSPSQVEYVITNTGTTTVIFSYIIIQDDVLMLTNGEETLAPGQQTTVSASGQNMHLHKHDLQLSEIGNN